MIMLGKIRRVSYRDGLCRSATARRTGLWHDTIKKWLRASWRAEPKYRPRGRPSYAGSRHNKPLTATQRSDWNATGRREIREGSHAHAPPGEAAEHLVPKNCSAV